MGKPRSAAHPGHLTMVRDLHACAAFRPSKELCMKRPVLAFTASLCCASLLAAAGSAVAQTKTLRFVAHADVKILDPTFTTAYISRNFGYMVYDTLFAQDAKGVPKPQMVEKYTSSKDGKQWSFTLRPSLKFSDGNAVTAADCVASLQRWSGRDSTGRAMTAAGAEWKTVDAGTFTLTLKEPFGLVLEGLAKPSGFPPVILPERLAKAPTTAPLTEVVGSGPFIFKRDEWVPGNKVVFLKNPNYVGRKEPPSGLSGNKTPHIDRVEWLYLPDSNSSTAALKNGEVDMIEQVPPDYITPLRRPEHPRRQRWLVPGLHRLQPDVPAVQQRQGTPGRAARGEPGEVRRRSRLPARHASHVLRHLVHLRRPQRDRRGRRSLPQGRPGQGQAASRRGRLQGREDRGAGAHRHHVSQRRRAGDRADAEVDRHECRRADQRLGDDHGAAGQEGRTRGGRLERLRHRRRRVRRQLARDQRLPGCCLRQRPARMG